MEMSFYTAVTGATAQQAKLDVLANNMANANTYGFKGRDPVFTDLLYANMNAKENSPSNLKAGSGVRLDKTDLSLAQGTLVMTQKQLDFAISGEGLFGLLNPETQEVSYTRDGSFSLSRKGDDFYLVNASGKWVLGSDQQPIVVKKAVAGAEEDEEQFSYQETDSMEDILKRIVQDYDQKEGNGKLKIGLFHFANSNGIVSLGKNEFAPAEKNGEPLVAVGTPENMTRGALEQSNIFLPDEFANIIESQRAYQYALRMVQTSDEVFGVVNGLR